MAFSAKLALKSWKSTPARMYSSIVMYSGKLQNSRSTLCQKTLAMSGSLVTCNG